MQGASRDSLAAARERLDEQLVGADGSAVGQQLFAVVDLLDRESALRRRAHLRSRDRFPGGNLFCRYLFRRNLPRRHASRIGNGPCRLGAAHHFPRGDGVDRVRCRLGCCPKRASRDDSSGGRPGDGCFDRFLRDGPFDDGLRVRARRQRGAKRDQARCNESRRDDAGWHDSLRCSKFGEPADQRRRTQTRSGGTA